MNVFDSVILKGRTAKSDFPEGLHKISYTVYDRAGNKGSCRFTVRVRGESPNTDRNFFFRSIKLYGEAFGFGRIALLVSAEYSLVSGRSGSSSHMCLQLTGIQTLAHWIL